MLFSVVEVVLLFTCESLRGLTDSENEEIGHPVLVRKMRRKAYCVRYPDDFGVYATPTEIRGVGHGRSTFLVDFPPNTVLVGKKVCLVS